MYIARLENADGEVLTLSQNETQWQILSITGVNPPQAQVNLTNIAGLDGSRFNSSKLGTRNLVIMLRLNGNVEENRLTLYRFCRTKDECTFYYTTESRNVKIKGITETVECDLFAQGEIMQISIICPYPYFSAIDDIVTEFSKEIPLFTFPFYINMGAPIAFSLYSEDGNMNVFNNSETETGIIIKIDVLAAINKIVISNNDTSEAMTLNYSFATDDQIIINTNAGEKSVTLIRSGASTNLFSALDIDSEFIQLRVGDNRFSYSVDNVANTDNVIITVSYSPIYRGV